MSCRVALLGIGLVGPGLDGWESSVPILAGRVRYEDGASLPTSSAGILTPNLRRRTTATIRLAFSAGEQAIAHSGLTADGICTLFSSSHGDMEVADALCRALALTDHLVSPTRFHNSVHNAAAAYWSIATGSQLPSTSIAAFAASFASGLLDAAVFACAEDREVLLIAYDVPAPHPMSLAAPVLAPFGVALVLAPRRESDDLGQIEPRLASGVEVARMFDPGLEQLRQGNSAAQCLPLLSAIARGATETLAMPYLKTSQLCVQYEPGTRRFAP